MTHVLCLLWSLKGARIHSLILRTAVTAHAHIAKPFYPPNRNGLIYTGKYIWPMPCFRWRLGPPGTDPVGSGHNRAREHDKSYKSYSELKSMVEMIEVKGTPQCLTFQKNGYLQSAIQNHTLGTLHALCKCLGNFCSQG